jgi:SAM-dependent methyltransferase
LFFEMFSGLPRQGPGDAASTRRALSMIPGVSPATRILDLGCGTGAQTLVIAEHSHARVTAIERHRPYVTELTARAQARALADRVDARVGNMCALDFASGSFDLIWCEGAIYIPGFEHGLRLWRPLLAPGGCIAVTEVCWTKPDPPAECTAFWAREYAAIRDVPALLQAIAACGYETIGHFALPSSAWWDEYYRPLQRHVESFRARHRGESDAEELAVSVQREIDVWRAYGDFYGYEFFVMRAAPI